MSRILLTGAGGVVGNAIYERLRGEHDLLTVTSKNIPGAVKMDMQNWDKAAIKNFTPEIVIHAAWDGSDSAKRNDPELLERNATASLELLKLVAEEDAQCWISFGSQAEYSPNLSGAISESSPTEPTTPYGRTKLNLGRKQLEFCAQHNMRGYWLRLFSCYSKLQTPPYLLPYLLECKRNGAQPNISTPQAVEDFLHAEDVAAAVAKVMGGNAESAVYNVASGVGISVGDAAKLLGLDVPPTDAAATGRVADISKFSKTFDWKPAISLKEGLARSL